MNTITLFAAAQRDNPVALDAERRMNTDRRRVTTATKILERLRAGPATNIELAAITPRYGGRIHDLRKLGVTISTTHGAGGLVVYALEAER